MYIKKILKKEEEKKKLLKNWRVKAVKINKGAAVPVCARVQFLKRSKDSPFFVLPEVILFSTERFLEVSVDCFNFPQKGKKTRMSKFWIFENSRPHPPPQKKIKNFFLKLFCLTYIYIIGFKPF